MKNEKKTHLIMNPSDIIPAWMKIVPKWGNKGDLPTSKSIAVWTVKILNVVERSSKIN